METLRALIQACGRTVRGPDDLGETIILDDLAGLRKAVSRYSPTWWVDGFHGGRAALGGR